MAIVRKLIEGPQTARVHPSETDAVVQVVRPVGGGVLLQVSTFGSDERLSEPKVSQTIQLDEISARALGAIIESTFGAAGT